MAFPKPPPWLKTVFAELADELHAERRVMFGCPVAFAGGHLACGVFGTSVFVRVGPEETERLLATEGAEPFAPVNDRPMRAFTVLPREVIEDDATLRAWMARALDYSRSLPPKEVGKAATARRGAARRTPDRTSATGRVKAAGKKPRRSGRGTA